MTTNNYSYVITYYRKTEKNYFYFFINIFKTKLELSTI